MTFAIKSQVPHKPNVLFFFSNVLLIWKYESRILSRIFFFLFLQNICFRKGNNSPLFFGGVAFYLPMFDSFADFYLFLHFAEISFMLDFCIFYLSGAKHCCAFLVCAIIFWNKRNMGSHLQKVNNSLNLVQWWWLTFLLRF